MGLFERLFGKKQEPNIPKNEEGSAAHQSTAPASEWEELPAFVEADPAEYELVSVVATAIAAGERPDSKFIVKKILKRNPEAKIVSLVAASLAAGAIDDCQLVVKKISKKKQIGG